VEAITARAITVVLILNTATFILVITLCIIILVITLCIVIIIITLCPHIFIRVLIQEAGLMRIAEAGPEAAWRTRWCVRMMSAILFFLLPITLFVKKVQPSSAPQVSA
jgi:hypothetical protein